MIIKKIISVIILSFMLFSGLAQEVNKFEKFQDRLEKGNSTLGFNINLMQYIESADFVEFNISPSIEYSYFLVNRLSLNTSFRFYQQFYSNLGSKERNLRSEKSINIWLRYYFFKRGGFFVGLGGSLGHVVVDYDNELAKKFYVVPTAEIGYSYMVSNMWKSINNKVSINFAVGTYIPVKKYSKFDQCDQFLPYFPFFHFEVGVTYYFMKKTSEKKK